MSTIASDLSPFYLAKARDNVNYWKQERAARLDLGGPEGTGGSLSWPGGARICQTANNNTAWGRAW
jgi:hypothetical protein